MYQSTPSYLAKTLAALCCCWALAGCATTAPPSGAAPKLAFSEEEISGEGMWPWAKLASLDEEKLINKGLKIPLAHLWKKEEGGLLEAAVGLGGCSGSFISAGGLLLTNHHCVFGAVQRNSTEENNLLEQGFFAPSPSEELPAPGTEIFAFESFEDVTEQVKAAASAAGDDIERALLVERKEKELVAACEAAPGTYCQVFRYNNGLEFQLAKSIRLLDLRLVAIPPRSLGEFGGETDNFRWPRHTMDFSILRAYVAPDGTPARYSEDNVPFVPKRFFAVNPRGVGAGDLVMVVGTPYLTRRYLTSAAVRALDEHYYGLRGELFPDWIRTLEATCKEIPASCIKTVGHIKSVNNGLTSTKGINAELAKGELHRNKRALEDEWRAWVASDDERTKRYGGTLDALIAFANEDARFIKKDLLLRYMTSTRFSHLLGYAVKLVKWAEEQSKPNAERSQGYQERDRMAFELMLTQKQGSIHKEADKRVLTLFISYLSRLGDDQQLPYFKDKLGADAPLEIVAQFLQPIFDGTSIDDAQTRLSWMGSSFKELEQNTDPFIRLALALKDETDAAHDRKLNRIGAYLRLRPRYISSLIEMLGSNFYPDANRSPRVTFGTVVGYQKADLWSPPFTTHAGLVKKTTGIKPFDAPSEVVEQTDFEPYVLPNTGELPIAFISSCDTTGGNSGSAALDGSGRLVGVNFDRVFENIAGDFGYDHTRSRNIMVDIRAILWYLDKILGADHLLEELNVSNPSH